MSSRGYVLLETTTLKAVVNVTDPSCQQQDHTPKLNNIHFINSMIASDSNHPTIITHNKILTHHPKMSPLIW